MTLKGALFDLDGVIIDSEGSYTEFWKNIDQIYPTGVENFALAIKGTTLEEILKYYPDPSVQTDILRRIDKFQAEMTYHLFPGVESFLVDLKNNGIKMAIVTSSDNLKMERLFSQIPNLKDYFDAVIDASVVERSKPDPDGYLKGAASLGLSATDCCVFEDSLQGVRAGRASGAKVIGLTTTLPASTLTGEADILVDDLSRIATFNALIDLIN